MPPARLDSVLEATLLFGRWDPRSDAELLTRFLDDREDSAFEALLVRHTPAVRAVCRGWLRSAADVDDAAQATFLVLVKRADSIRDRAAVGRWLLRTADFVARRLKRDIGRAGPLTADVEANSRTELPASDAAAVAAEVARLPPRHSPFPTRARPATVAPSPRRPRRHAGRGRRAGAHGH